jgi:peptide/nickel transport system substrate-binding protein
MFATADKRRSRLIRSAVIAAVAAGALLLSACSGTSSSKGSADTTLTIASTTTPASLDPATAANGIPSVWYMNLGYEALIERDPDGTAKPGLATKWGYSDDRLTFTIELRKGVKFSDGSDLTADAVAASLNRYLKEGQFSATYLSAVTSITATGPLEVTIKLSAPNPMLPYGLDQGGIAGDIVAPAGLADPKKLGSGTFGAGPYMLDSKATIANSQYVYVQNPHYYDKAKQHWKKIVVKVITDQNSVLSAVRSGQVQVAQGSSSNAAAAKSAGLNVTTGPSGMVGMYIADIDGTITPALKDVRVRQALNYALDRKAITKSVYGEYGTPTDQFVPKGTAGYLASLEEEYPYDPAKAKELLKEAGYADGFSFTLAEQPGTDNGDLLAQAMVAQWKDVGVNVTLKSFPSFSDYVSGLLAKTIPATTLTFNYSVQLTDTGQLVTNPATYNYLGFTDAKANALAAEQRKYDIDSADGKKAAENSETYMVKGAFLVPVAATDALLFSSKKIAGLDFTAYPWPDPTNWKPAD